MIIKSKTSQLFDLGLSNKYTWEASGVLVNKNVEIELKHKHVKLDCGVDIFCLVASNQLGFSSDRTFDKVLIKWFRGNNYKLPEKFEFEHKWKTEAMERYNNCFCGINYRKITNNLSSKSTNKILDNFLVLCGHPHCDNEYNEKIIEYIEELI